MRAPSLPAFILAALAAACSQTPAGGGSDAGTPSLDFTVGGYAFHISDAAATTTGGVLALHLSDQPDACAALQAQPVMPAMMLSLKVQPRADGTTAATVVPTKAIPAAGEAEGALVRAIGGVPAQTFDTNDGRVAWTSDSDGSALISYLDVGFAGAAGRVTLQNLALSACGN